MFSEKQQSVPPKFSPICNKVSPAKPFAKIAVGFKDVQPITENFFVNPQYLRHENQGRIPDFRHWQIPLGRRFRSLKIWFVLRLYGIENLQKYIRNHVNLAKLFESLIIEDGRMEIVEEVILGLVCFRPKGENKLAYDLFISIERDGRLHIVTGNFSTTNIYFLRFSVNYQFATKEHIKCSYAIISELADKILGCKPKSSSD